MLVLGETEVERTLTIDDAITAVQQAFESFALPGTANLPRRRLALDGANLNVLGGALADVSRLAVKAYTTGSESCVLLFDARERTLLAAIAAGHLGRTRTGAASAVATRALSRPDSRVLALVGTGRQAMAQAEAICRVRDIRQVRVVSRDPAHVATFTEALASKVDAEVVAAASVRQAVTGSDIVTTITTSSDPVLDVDLLEPGMHLNLAGANQPTRREVDVTVVDRCDLVTVDDPEQARMEAAPLRAAVDEGVLGWPDVAALPAVLNGEVAGRRHDDDVTAYFSLGVGTQDVAAASLVYDRARELGLGVTI